MVNTVLGPRSTEELGITLMHEHLLIGFPGWQADVAAPPFARREALRRCIDRMEELKELGLRTLVDPCPIDLGRDVEFAAEVAQVTGVHIVCATGLYKEDQGAAAYFKLRSSFADAVAEMTEAFVKEITEGVGGTGIKPGVIKVATGEGRITPYEEVVLRAAARAHRATGVPITTHTESGTMGPQQVDVLVDEQVDPKCVLVGHCCGNSDLRYHLSLLDRGCYVGFDRFGLEVFQPDRVRMAALLGLIGVGCDDRIVLSHDSVWCWLGRPLFLPEGIADNWNPTYVFRRIIPWLRESGVAESKIENLLVHNARRFFGG